MHYAPCIYSTFILLLKKNQLLLFLPFVFSSFYINVVYLIMNILSFFLLFFSLLLLPPPPPTPPFMLEYTIVLFYFVPPPPPPTFIFCDLNVSVSVRLKNYLIN